MTENLKTALNIAVSAIATEHFFTAFLSYSYSLTLIANKFKKDDIIATWSSSSQG